MVQTVELEKHILYSNGRLYSKIHKRFLKPLTWKRSNNHRWAEGKISYPKYRINKKFVAIHRLVAKHFLPKKAHQNIVIHLDNDVTNYHLSNLAWSTQKINMQMFAEQRRAA